MKLEGVHHITAITGDAPRNVDFYARVLGMRMVKKTVNQDDPSVYHLFYADELGSGGADLTFFEYPGAAPGGRARAWCTASSRGSPRAKRSTSGRSGSAARASQRSAPATACASPTPRGWRTSSQSSTGPTRRSIARHREIPAEFALQGFEARARFQHAARLESPHARGGARVRALRGRLGGARRGARRHLRATTRCPDVRGVPGAGTVHHVAWASTLRGPRGLGRAGARARPASRRR